MNTYSVKMENVEIIATATTDTNPTKTLAAFATIVRSGAEIAHYKVDPYADKTPQQVSKMQQESLTDMCIAMSTIAKLFQTQSKDNSKYEFKQTTDRHNEIFYIEQQHNNATQTIIQLIINK